MRFGITSLSRLALAMLVPAAPARAAHLWAFGPDVQVSHSPASTVTGSVGHHNVLVRGDRVFVFWEDRRHGHPTIYFARSLDGGATFEPEILVNESGSGEILRFAADASGDRVYVLWQGVRFGPTDRGLYLDRSFDGGATFGEDRYLEADCPGPFPQGSAVMATDGEDLLLLAWTWQDSVYAMRSADGGQSFSCPSIVDVFPFQAWHCCPEVVDAAAVSDGTACVMYATTEGDLGACALTHVLRSADGGIGFVRTNDGSCGQAMSFALSGPGSVLQHAWMFEFTSIGLARPEHSRSADGGTTWQSRTMDSWQDGGGVPVSIDARGSTVGMLWTRPNQGVELVFAGSIDEGLTWTGPVLVSDAPGAGAPSVGIADDGDACVVWTQNEKVYFDRGVFSTTTAVGGEGTTSERLPVLRVSPNPSRDGFEVRLAESAGTTSAVIDIYDATGRRVRSLELAGAPSRIEAFWDGRDAGGAPAPSGVYFARPRGESRAREARVVIVR